MAQDDLDTIARRFSLTAECVDALATLLETRTETAAGTPLATFVSITPDDEPTQPAAPARDRYERLGLLGLGGMGEVHRVHDAVLRRTVAMKRVRGDLVRNASVVGRFLQEAQATAQLEHPGIVPVYDQGVDADGRPWFTMREVHGRTLSRVIEHLHDDTDPERRWTLRAVIDVFRRVCETVAYAHDRGVVHRDLKPENVMVGAFGEVLVMDWGLARLVGTSDRSVGSDRVSAGTGTRIGAVVGTPGYMAPEQARGEAATPSADVYALGATLHAILHRVPPDLPPAGALPVPEPLDAIRRRALTDEPRARWADASDLERAVSAWLDDADRTERALTLCDDAAARLPEVDDKRRRADALRAAAADRVRALEPWDPVAEHAEGWALDQAATDLLLEAEVDEVAAIRGLQGALAVDPDLPQAHQALAAHFAARHAQAERVRDAVAAARYEALVRVHDRGPLAGWLIGDGAVSLATDAPCDVEVFRYEEIDHRLTAVPTGRRLEAPFHEVPFPRGSYLLVLSAPGRARVRYPVRVDRGTHWSGVAPGDDTPTPVRLPRDGELGLDDILVPAGWFSAGGDPVAGQALPSMRVWVDAFVIRRFPVTFAEYLSMLDARFASGDLESTLIPGDRREGTIVVVDAAGARIVPDRDGDLIRPDWPVMLIDHRGATAYAAWLAEQSGLSWRLPSELEREKAGRGVDGRLYPWGNRHHPDWSCVQESHRGARALPQPVDSFPVDESPYGVRGLAGNVKDFCIDAMSREGPAADGGRLAVVAATGLALRVSRGGSFGAAAICARQAFRSGAVPHFRSGGTGFRLVRPYG